MARTKNKNWIRKSFSFDEDIVEKLSQSANFEDMTETNFLEFLVLNWDSGIDPEEKLNELIEKRNKKIGETNKIEEEIKKTSEHIRIFNDWKKEKALKKNVALQFIEKHIVRKEFTEAETLSKFWQKKTGISGVELLMEAKQNVENKGI